MASYFSPYDDHGVNSFIASTPLSPENLLNPLATAVDVEGNPVVKRQRITDKIYDVFANASNYNITPQEAEYHGYLTDDMTASYVEYPLMIKRSLDRFHLAMEPGSILFRSKKVVNHHREYVVFDIPTLNYMALQGSIAKLYEAANKTRNVNNLPRLANRHMPSIITERFSEMEDLMPISVKDFLDKFDYNGTMITDTGKSERDHRLVTSALVGRVETRNVWGGHIPEGTPLFLVLKHDNIDSESVTDSFGRLISYKQGDSFQALQISGHRFGDSILPTYDSSTTNYSNNVTATRPDQDLLHTKRMQHLILQIEETAIRANNGVISRTLIDHTPTIPRADLQAIEDSSLVDIVDVGYAFSVGECARLVDSNLEDATIKEALRDSNKMNYLPKIEVYAH